MVIGTAKSGTTWVQKMLNGHPEIYCPGESKFTYLVRAFGKAVAEYNRELDFTNRIVYSDGAFYRTWDDIAVATGFQFLAALSWANAEHENIRSVRYIGDKDTAYHTSNLINVWRDLLFNEAKVIHVIRDGRDSAISVLRHRQRVGGYSADVGSVDFDAFLRGYAKEWAANIRRTRAAFREFPHLYFEVHYEDLLQEPAKGLGAIFDFLEVEYSPTLVRNIATENAFFKLSGGRAAGQEDRGSFYRRGTSGEWNEVFDARSKQIFIETSGDLLAELGYDT